MANSNDPFGVGATGLLRANETEDPRSPFESTVPAVAPEDGAKDSLTQLVLGASETQVQKTASQAKRAARDSLLTASAVAARTLAQPLYDEFSIGWNEIFDPEPQESIPKTTRSAKGAGATTEHPASSSSHHAAVGHASQMHAADPDQMPAANSLGDAFWASEVLTSRKPPAYLRTEGGNQSAIDRGLKEHLLRCPASRLRKPSFVMEMELNQLRYSLMQEHRDKRVKARRNRRLQRKCTVRPHEDIDELEQRYGVSSHLQPLQDLTEVAESKPTKPLSKEFFMGLGRRNLDAARAAGWPMEPQSAR